jgi:hypothetical protein
VQIKLALDPKHHGADGADDADQDVDLMVDVVRTYNNGFYHGFTQPAQAFPADFAVSMDALCAMLKLIYAHFVQSNDTYLIPVMLALDRRLLVRLL